MSSAAVVIGPLRTDGNALPIHRKSLWLYPAFLRKREEKRECAENNTIRPAYEVAPIPIKGSPVLKVATFSGSHKPQYSKNEPVLRGHLS